MRRWIRPLAAVLAGVAVGSCSSASRHSATPTPTAAVVVASFNFPESEVVAEIYAQSLEHAGIPVRRELDLGPRELVRPALQDGLVDLVPEYLGTALTSIDPSADVRVSSPGLVLTELRAALRRWGLTALTPAAAADQNGFAVTARTAGRYGLETLSDLAPVAYRLVLGGASECPTRPLCLLGLRDVYGLRFRGFEAFDDVAQRAEALAQGVIDVEVTFTTDPRLADGSFVLLRDDRGLQPVESVVPVVSDRVLHRYGDRLRSVLDAVSTRLDSQALTFLNWRLTEAGKPVAGEAHGWLLRHGLVDR